MSESTPTPIEDTEAIATAGLEGAPSTPAPITATPGSPEAENLPIQIAVVDISKARRDMARDAADERLNNETQGKGGVRGFVRRIWKGSVAREYYRQKYYHQEIENIDESGNLFASRGGDDTDSVRSVAERFIGDYEGSVREGAGERKTILDRESQPAVQIRESLHDLIGQFCDGDLDEDNFEEAKNQVLKDVARQHPELFGEGMLFADNLLTIAQNARAAVRHGANLDTLMSSAEVVVGEAKMGQRTEARYSAIDRAAEKLQSTKVGSWVNETTVATGLSIAASIGTWAKNRSLAVAVGLTGAVGASGAIIAGLRESKRIKEDRATHARERAAGIASPEADQKRRAGLEETRYETLSASELTAQLNDLLDQETGQLREMDSEQFMSSVHLLADASARVRLSDQQSIDLVDFSSVETIEQERSGLLLAIAKAKVALRHSFDARRGDLPATDDEIENFEQLLEIVDQIQTDGLSESMSGRDDLFRTLRRKRVAMAFVAGGIVGATLGFGMQEAHALVSSGFQGVIGHNEGSQRSTLLHALTEGKSSSHEAAHAATTNSVMPINEHASLNLPHGVTAARGPHGAWLVHDGGGKEVMRLQTDRNGLINPASAEQLRHLGGNIHETTKLEVAPGQLRSTTVGNHVFKAPESYHTIVHDKNVTLTDASGKQVAELHLTSSGTLDKQSQDLLRAHHIDVSTRTVPVHHVVETQVSSDTLVNNHLAETTHVHRVLWYGNDTPRVYDQNELRTYAGGPNGSWFDSHGNVILDITPMKPGGSFQGGQHANPFDLVAQHRLTLGVSASNNTQSHTFNYAFNNTPDGHVQAVIPKGSPVYQLFAMENGRHTFHGKYFEVTEMTGVHESSGAEQVKILGTYVGNQASTVIDRHTVVGHSYVTTLHPRVNVTHQLVDVPEIKTAPPIIVSPPIVPILARQGLETMPREERLRYYGYNYESPEDIEERNRDLSPTLRDNPNAILNPSAELSRYRELVRERAGEDYLAEIDAAVGSSELLKSITKVKAIVAIPVAAASESENIYRTLSLYHQQDETAREDTAILLHLNWVDEALNDDEKRAKIEKTRSEITRAQVDFPELRIAIVESEWKQSDIDEGSGVIGKVGRKLYDTAMMSLELGMREGRLPTDQDVLIIRNDADARGMGRAYLKNMLSAFDSQADGDIFVGAYRWDTEKHGRFPGFGVAMNFNEVLHALTARRSSPITTATPGGNSSFRVSTLAAVGAIGFSTYTGAGSDDVEIGGRVRQARSQRTGSSRSGYLRGLLSGASSGSEADASTGNTKPIKYVRAAQVDTDGSRLLSLWREGRSLNDAWSDFDDGGYKERDAGGATTAVPADDIDDIAVVAHKLEEAITLFADSWYPDPETVRMGLRLTFPERDANNDRIYTMNWRGGKARFEFTPAGEEWLKNSLTRDSKGRFDPLGSRTRRRLYSETRPGAAKRPLATEPRFVK